jgi:uncharacterized glyoxalase superfamily protein PhnB
VFPHIRYEEPGPAVAWLTRVFGLREQVRLAGDDGTVYVSELEGPDGGRLMVGGVTPAYKAMIRQRVPDFREPNERPWPNLSHSTTVIVADVDAHHGHARAQGATILTTPDDQPWGIREYEALDLEGHHWQFGQVIRLVAPEEWGAHRVSPP